MREEATGRPDGGSAGGRPLRHDDPQGGLPTSRWVLADTGDGAPGIAIAGPRSPLRRGSLQLREDSLCLHPAMAEQWLLRANFISAAMPRRAFAQVPRGSQRPPRRRPRAARARQLNGLILNSRTLPRVVCGRPILLGRRRRPGRCSSVFGRLVSTQPALATGTWSCAWPEAAEARSRGRFSPQFNRAQPHEAQPYGRCASIVATPRPIVHVPITICSPRLAQPMNLAERASGTAMSADRAPMPTIEPRPKTRM